MTINEVWRKGTMVYFEISHSLSACVVKTTI